MRDDRVKKQRLLDFARQMRKAPSDAERKLWQALLRNQLDGLNFRRQHGIGPFISDFACVAYQLIVEIDGVQHDQAVDYDERRTGYLRSLGWRVIRFSASDVVKNLNAALDTILRDSRPPP